MKIIFTILIILLLAVLIVAAIKIIGILLKTVIWVVIALLIVILINYVLLPHVGRVPLKLGLEKIYRTESANAKKQIKKVEMQKDKILKKITPKSAIKVK